MVGADVPSVPTDGLVATRAEGFSPFPREDDDADLRVIAGIGEAAAHLLDGEGGEGVALMGAVDGDLGQAFPDCFRVDDFLEGRAGDAGFLAPHHGVA